MRHLLGLALVVVAAPRSAGAASPTELISSSPTRTRRPPPWSSWWRSSRTPFPSWGRRPPTVAISPSAAGPSWACAGWGRPGQRGADAHPRGLGSARAGSHLGCRGPHRSCAGLRGGPGPGSPRSILPGYPPPVHEAGGRDAGRWPGAERGPTDVCGNPGIPTSGRGRRSAPGSPHRGRAPAHGPRSRSAGAHVGRLLAGHQGRAARRCGGGCRRHRAGLRVRAGCPAGALEQQPPLHPGNRLAQGAGHPAGGGPDPLVRLGRPPWQRRGQEPGRQQPEQPGPVRGHQWLTPRMASRSTANPTAPSTTQLA